MYKIAIITLVVEFVVPTVTVSWSRGNKMWEKDLNMYLKSWTCDTRQPLELEGSVECKALNRIHLGTLLAPEKGLNWIDHFSMGCNTQTVHTVSCPAYSQYIVSGNSAPQPLTRYSASNDNSTHLHSHTTIPTLSLTPTTTNTATCSTLDQSHNSMLHTVKLSMAKLSPNPDHQH